MSGDFRISLKDHIRSLSFFHILIRRFPFFRSSREGYFFQDVVSSDSFIDDSIAREDIKKIPSGGLLVLGIVFLGLLGRSALLQLVYAPDYASLADRNRFRIKDIPAPRGVIYDRNGFVLAQNRPTFDLVLDLAVCSKSPKLSDCQLELSKLTARLSVLDIPTLTNSAPGSLSSGHLTVARNLTKDQLLALELGDLPAVSFRETPIREYLYPYEFAHLIGYTGLSNNTLAPVIEGKLGVEKSYDPILRGVPGREVSQVNSRSQNLKEFDSQEPISGKNVTLFADLGLQKLAYSLLKEAVEVGVGRGDHKQRARAGVVIAQDPRTGGVLALVSYPSFDAQRMVLGLTSADLHAMEQAGPQPFFNRAIGAGYAPGSTFKLVMASAILEEHIVSPTFSIFDTGSIKVGDHVFRNWKRSGHGEVDLLRALQVSNDPYFYIMGGGYKDIKGLGIERIHAWAERFGFGHKTGIDIPGEISGFVPDANYKRWYLGDTYITSIGQGDFLATPLQINLMSSYFANGHELLQPRVVKSIGGESTKRRVLAKDLISEDTLALVREGARRAVSPGGTAYPLFDFPQKHSGILVGGKTGTSEYVTSDGRLDTHAVFTAWAPLENAEIVLTVFLEGGGSGAHNAAPIARKLLDYWFDH